MNILFFIPSDPFIKNHWDGEQIRTGGAAVSGTHQTVVLVAEYLAKHTPHTIYVMNFVCNYKLHNGVQYVNMMHQLPEDIHVLVVPNWINHIPLPKISALRHFIIWYHCCGYNAPAHQIMQSLVATNHVRISFVHLSDWSTANILHGFRNAFPVYKQLKISNALMIDTIPADIKFDISRPNNSIFFACWDRGAEMAERCWNKLKAESPGGKWGDFLKLDYSTNIKGDKKFVFENFANARYFIYPLINLKNNYIHRDTFSCTVAEAIACGVEVLTYPIAALREYYDGLVTWIPMPVDVAAVEAHDLFIPCVPQLGSPSQDDHIIRLIEDIDANYASRESLRRERAAKVIERFAPDNCLAPWRALVE